MVRRLSIVLQDGDQILLITLGNYVGDLNETFFVGNVDEASRQLVNCTYECLEKAISIGKCFFLLRFVNIKGV